MQCGGHSYTVEKGDTLWGISKRFLGKGSEWRRILSFHNDCCVHSGNCKRITDPSRIKPGDIINIPIPANSKPANILSFPRPAPPRNPVQLRQNAKSEIFAILNMNWGIIHNWPVPLMVNFVYQQSNAAQSIGYIATSKLVADFISTIGKKLTPKTFSIPLPIGNPTQSTFRNSNNTVFSWKWNNLSFKSKYEESAPGLEDLAAYDRKVAEANQKVLEATKSGDSALLKAATEDRDKLIKEAMELGDKVRKTTLKGQFGTLTIKQDGANPFTEPTSVGYVSPTWARTGLSFHGKAYPFDSTSAGLKYAGDIFMLKSTYDFGGSLDVKGNFVFKKDTFRWFDKDVTLSFETSLKDVNYINHSTIQYNIAIPDIPIARKWNLGVKVNDITNSQNQRFFGLTLKYAE